MGYRPGTQYPVLVIVYPGTRYDSLDGSPSAAGAADKLLLVNHGCAVLQPTIPTDHFDVAHETGGELAQWPDAGHR
jgi:hypothetical protein